MAIPVWPAEMPQRVLQDGYSERMPDGRLRTPMDFGPGKVRNRYSSAPRMVTAQILVAAGLVARFNRFWVEETGGGALNFVIPDQIFNGRPITDSSGAPVVDGAGNPILITAKWLARFGDAPSITPNGSWFVISFPLIVLP